MSGCSGPGPVPLADGSYRLYATSADTAAQPGADVEGVGDEKQLTDGQETVSRGLRGSGSDEVLVCPPSGRGAPQRLDGPVTVGGIAFISPALVGDCGRTRAVRVTLVDLDTVDEGQQFPFTTWVEFCDVADADC